MRRADLDRSPFVWTYTRGGRTSRGRCRLSKHQCKVFSLIPHVRADFVRVIRVDLVPQHPSPELTGSLVLLPETRNGHPRYTGSNGRRARKLGPFLCTTSTSDRYWKRSFSTATFSV